MLVFIFFIMNKISFIIFELLVVLSLIVVPFEMNKSKQTSNNMNWTIVIDPGHGGKDNGCNYQDVYEDELNLAIAKELFEEMQNNQFISYLTRDGDYDLAYNHSANRKNDDLLNRVKIINRYNTDILVSVHMNYYQNSSVNGPMVYYRINDEESLKLANIIQEKLNNVANTNKKVHSDDFYLFRKSNCVAILIECGFISNKMERERLLSSTYQSLLARQISEGIMTYLNER